MTARDAATIACRVLAVYTIFESFNVHTRYFFQNSALGKVQHNYTQLLIIPLLILFALYVWFYGGKLISRSLNKSEDKIDTILSKEQLVCLALACVGFLLLVSSFHNISYTLIMLSSQSSPSNFSGQLSLFTHLFMPVYGFVLIIFSKTISKILLFLHTFKQADNRVSDILTVQSLSLSILGIWLLGRFLPQLFQYAALFLVNPSQAFSMYAQVAIGSWIQFCFALTLIFGARGIVGLFYLLRIWGNPFAEQDKQ